MRAFQALVLSAVVAGSAGMYAQSGATKTNLKVGDRAPDFSLPASTGQTISLSQFLGKKAVVLAFFTAAFTGG